MKHDQIRVWDLAVRIFHWSLVILFTVAWFSGEESDLIHSWSGYAVLALVIFRIIWGFIGTKYARFSEFFYSPAKITGYLKSLRTARPEHYLGHNPAGGLMVFIMLINLLLVSWTGLEAWGAEGHGPLAQTTQVEFISEANASSVDKQQTLNTKENPEEKFWEEWHEFFTDLMLFLIFIHVTGVIVSSRIHKENLVKAMFTGYKNEQ